MSYNLPGVKYVTCMRLMGIGCLNVSLLAMPSTGAHSVNCRSGFTGSW